MVLAILADLLTSSNGGSHVQFYLSVDERCARSLCSLVPTMYRLLFCGSNGQRALQPRETDLFAMFSIPISTHRLKMAKYNGVKTFKHPTDCPTGMKCPWRSSVRWFIYHKKSKQSIIITFCLTFLPIHAALLPISGCLRMTLSHVDRAYSL